jgi:ABC-type transport system substrate-binding protein
VDGLLCDPVRSEHDRAPQDLIPGRRRLFAWASLLAIAAAIGGCGGDSTESVAPGSPPTPSGTLGIALPEAPETFDPLLATTPSDRLVAGQIFEPLTRRISGPYGETATKPGLAVSAQPGSRRTIWSIQLRPGVRFSDGARLNASAVLQNAMRWRSTPEGQTLLPGLAAADAPRPDLVRLIFAEPNANVVRQLASVRLGLVSPRDLRSAQAATRLADGLASGTGPFELHRHHPRGVLLSRNQGWWGSRQELGPGVELVDLRFPAGAERRLELLRDGTVQIAEGLGEGQLAELRRDPLLTDQAGPGSRRVGLERSVRGFISADDSPSLSRVWLTTVGAGAR